MLYSLCLFSKRFYGQLQNILEELYFIEKEKNKIGQACGNSSFAWGAPEQWYAMPGRNFTAGMKYTF